MATRSVQVLCDVHCSWDQEQPRYRVYVNDELFTERTWIWREAYLEEALTIEAAPGQYQIRVDLIDPSGTAKLKVKNPRVVLGLAQIDRNLRLEIYQ